MLLLPSLLRTAGSDAPGEGRNSSSAFQEVVHLNHANIHTKGTASLLISKDFQQKEIPKLDPSPHFVMMVIIFKHFYLNNQ